MTATNSAQGITAFMSARDRSRRVTFFFAVQASPANVRYSLMLRCSRVKRTHRSDAQYRTFHPTRQEAILQSFPRRCSPRQGAPRGAPHRATTGTVSVIGIAG